MIKKTVTYQDFNGVERTEDFYFNLTEAEIMELEIAEDGGFTSYIERLINAKDNATLMKVFKKLLLMSYGEKSADGRRFVKNKEITDAFAQSQAYSDIFMDLTVDDKAASDFINGIIPPQDALEKTLARARKNQQSSES